MLSVMTKLGEIVLIKKINSKRDKIPKSKNVVDLSLFLIIASLTLLS